MAAPAATNNKRGHDDDKHRFTLAWWAADVADRFTTYAFAGAVYGAFNPFPLPGGMSGWMATPRAGRALVPLPPLSSPASVFKYAGMWGTLTAVYAIGAGAPAFARGRREGWNDLFGVAAVYAYSHRLFRSERNLTLNNRAAAVVVIGSIIYANTGPP